VRPGWDAVRVTGRSAFTTGGAKVWTQATPGRSGAGSARPRRGLTTLRWRLRARALLRDAVGVEDTRDPRTARRTLSRCLASAILEGETALGHAVAGGGKRGAEDVHVGVREPPW
jgi:hypothetical protein